MANCTRPSWSVSSIFGGCSMAMAIVPSRLILYRAVGRSPWTVPDARVWYWSDQGVGPRGARPTRLSASELSILMRDTMLSRGEHLGQMHRSHRQAGPRQRALNLHEAAGVNRDHGIGAGPEDGIDLGPDHGSRHARELH